MPKHDDMIPLRHMLDHAREAIGMITGKKPEDLAKERMLELPQLVDYIIDIIIISSFNKSSNMVKSQIPESIGTL